MKAGLFWNEGRSLLPLGAALFRFTLPSRHKFSKTLYVLPLDRTYMSALIFQNVWQAQRLAEAERRERETSDEQLHAARKREEERRDEAMEEERRGARRMEEEREEERREEREKEERRGKEREEQRREEREREERREKDREEERREERKREERREEERQRIRESASWVSIEITDVCTAVETCLQAHAEFVQVCLCHLCVCSSPAVAVPLALGGISLTQRRTHTLRRPPQRAAQTTGRSST